MDCVATVVRAGLHPYSFICSFQIALLFLVSAVLNQCGAQPQRRANIHPVRQGRFLIKELFRIKEFLLFFISLQLCLVCQQTIFFIHKCCVVSACKSVISATSKG